MPKIIKSRLIPRLCEIGTNMEVHGGAVYPFIFIHPVFKKGKFESGHYKNEHPSHIK